MRPQIFLMLSLFISKIAAKPQSLAPTLFFSDLESGPKTGGANNAGVFVTIYGQRFGATQGTSYVSIGGGTAASYPIWSDTRITFQPGAAATTGTIELITSSGTSNALPFTVRAGNIYFVATNGKDGNKGTFNSPWKTLPHAVQTIAAGDTIYAENGVSQTVDDGQGWQAALTLRSEWCGTSGNPRALLAYPGATVTIGNPNGLNPPTGIRSTDFSSGDGPCGGEWVFGEIELRGIQPVAIAGPSQQWRFIGNDISCPNSNGSGGGGACFETSLASYVKVLGNNVHDAGTAGASALFQGVYFSTDSNHVEMGWNTVANVHGCRGVQIHSSPLGSGYPHSGYNQYDIAIHDNVIHDTQCDGIIADTVDPSKGPISIYNNVIYNAGKGPNNPEQSGSWSCIYVPGTTETGAPGSGMVEVFNNTLYDCGAFVTPPFSNANAAIIEGGGNVNLIVHIRNNLVYQLPTTLFPGGVPYVVVWNPGKNAGGVCAASANCPWMQGTNNLFWGRSTVEKRDPANIVNSINANPLLVDPGQYNFQLQSGSPAANGGVSVPDNFDILGVPLPQGSGYPIGAYALPGH